MSYLGITDDRRNLPSSTVSLEPADGFTTVSVIGMAALQGNAVLMAWLVKKGRATYA